MISLRFPVAALGAALLAAAAPARAQTPLPTFSLEGNVLYDTFHGRDFRGVGDGGGFEVGGSVGVGAFALAAGYARTTHDLSDGGPAAVFSGPFVEPRLALPFYYREFTPYISGRVARITSRAGDSGGDVTAHATQLGGGLGMLVAMAPGVRLNVGLTYANVRFRDFEQGGVRQANSAIEGSNVGFRAGISLGGASWGVH